MTELIAWPYRLRSGHSDNPAEGACAMDAVNWLVHGKHGDAPECASPAIAEFVIVGNDAMPDAVRQRLLPYLHRIAGSRSPEHEAARVRIMWLAAVRVFAPRALDAAGLHDHAAQLRALSDDVTAAAAAARATEAAAEAKAARAAWAAAAWAAWAAEAAEAAEDWAWAAEAAAWAAAAWAEAWSDYFATLDAALAAGPQGEPWSADIVTVADNAFRRAGGLVTQNFWN